MSHRVALDPALRQRMAARHGRPLDPRRTAHIVVDLQNGFMEEGAPNELPTARAIVPAVNRISRALRAAGGTNVFIRWTPELAGAPEWHSLWATTGAEGRRRVAEAYSPGAHYHELWDGLDRLDDEPVVDKARYSCFVPGTSDLDRQLRARGIDTLIITGCLTNGCCESTTRSAMEMGYHVFFVEDGTATTSDAEHNATLTTVCGQALAHVLPADELVAKIEAANVPA